KNATYPLEFETKEDFLKWQQDGYKSGEPTLTPDQQEAFTQFAVNEAYYKYEMSDGHFDGDALPDVSRLFKKSKTSTSDPVNEQATAANSGNPNAAQNNS